VLNDLSEAHASAAQEDPMTKETLAEFIRKFKRESEKKRNGLRRPGSFKRRRNK